MELLLGTAEPHNVEAKIRTGKDEIIDMRVCACPIEYNGRKAVFSILLDLAEEKERHQLLKNAAEK